MAKIPEGTFQDWKDGETITSQDYKREREMMRIAINDIDGKAGVSEQVVDNKIESIDALKKPVTITKEGIQNSHIIEHTNMVDSTMDLLRVVRQGEDYTIFQVDAPETSVDGQREATITLMRHVDPDTGGPEFLDFYNTNYVGQKQFGIRMQKRGAAGVFRDFVIDFYDGKTFFEALRIKPSGNVEFGGIPTLMNDSDIYVDLRTKAGTRKGYFGYLKGAIGKLGFYNTTSGASLEVQDNGNIVNYSPTGDLLVYLDTGKFYLNDKQVATVDMLDSLKQSGLDGKNLLETSIKSKGGTVSKAGTTATFAELDTGLKSYGSFSQVITCSTTSYTFTLASGTTLACFYIDVPLSSLPFVPSNIIAFPARKDVMDVCTWNMTDIVAIDATQKGNATCSKTTTAIQSPFTLFPDKIRIPIKGTTASVQYQVIAFK